MLSSALIGCFTKCGSMLSSALIGCFKVRLNVELCSDWLFHSAAHFSSSQEAEPYRDRVATTEVQNAWSSRDSRRLQIVPGSALAGNSTVRIE